MQLLALGIPIQGGQADECPNEGNYVGYRMDAVSHPMNSVLCRPNRGLMTPT